MTLTLQLVGEKVTNSRKINNCLRKYWEQENQTVKAEGKRQQERALEAEEPSSKNRGSIV